MIDMVKVDLIGTRPITNEDLEGLDDQNSLFVAAHTPGTRSSQVNHRA